MTAKLHTISLGMVNCFVLKSEQTILIDAGVSGQMDRLLAGIKAANLEPTDIDLLLFTHSHTDHTGMAKEILELSQAQTACHMLEKDYLESGKSPHPRGTNAVGKFVAALMKLMPQSEKSPINIDTTFGDDDFSLGVYGIPGKVVYTPGHTLGSVSVLLDSGEAIVGDLAMNAMKLRGKPGLPIFAEDVGLVKSSWMKLLDLGAKVIYPSHGEPFSAEVLRQELG
jgi:glyoxylase-like metal-dependent hydrolase (beta-lactamase superfamily II)